MKEKVILLLSVLAGVIAFVATHFFLKHQLEAIWGKAEKIEVIAAARDLPAGTILEFDDLGKLTVFKRGVPENVFLLKDRDQLLDKKLLYTLKKGEVISWFHVDLPQREQAGLAPMIKPGMRAVSIAIGGDAAVSGLVNPNNRVDILGTFTFPSKTAPGEQETVTLTVLQDVTVLATGQRLARGSEEPYIGSQRGAGSYGTVTLQVTLREAELLIFAQNARGRLTLALRNPKDMDFEVNLPIVNFEHLQHELPRMNLERQFQIRGKTEKDIIGLSDKELQALRELRRRGE
ncbi:MAG: Flp pilus assembly protein CpaB [Kiritimatiellae bacterium]|nr:Flp pilus assembly protein CpaB [Kiritimatiellia bacterium]